MSAGGYCFDFGLSDAGYRRCRLPVGHVGDHQGHDGSRWADDVEPETCGYCGARYADATPADRPGTVAPRLAAPPAVRVSGGSAPLSEGDGDREAVSDLLSRRGEQTNLVARAAAETARAAEERALVEAYRRGRVVERRELDGLWCTPATGRALDRHGWTHAEVTAALRNLVEDGDRATVGGLLQVLDGYRPTRGGRAAGGTR